MIILSRLFSFSVPGTCIISSLNILFWVSESLITYKNYSIYNIFLFSNGTWIILSSRKLCTFLYKSIPLFIGLVLYIQQSRFFNLLSFRFFKLKKIKIENYSIHNIFLLSNRTWIILSSRKLCTFLYKSIPLFIGLVLGIQQILILS